MSKQLKTKKTADKALAGCRIVEIEYPYLQPLLKLDNGKTLAFDVIDHGSGTYQVVLRIK